MLFERAHYVWNVTDHVDMNTITSRAITNFLFFFVRKYHDETDRRPKCHFVFWYCVRYLSNEKLPSNLARRKSLRFTIKLQIHITRNTLHAFAARRVFMRREEKISMHSMYRLQASRTCAIHRHFQLIYT